MPVLRPSGPPYPHDPAHGPLRGSWRWLLWRMGGERANYGRLFLYGHWLTWVDRHRRLRDRDSVENLQRPLAVLSVIIGLVLLWGRTTAYSSAFERAVDAQMPWTALGLSVHRWSGLLLVVGGTATFVSIMEWPVRADREAAAGSEFERNRLSVLMRMQIAGTILSGTYWAVSFAVTLYPLTDPLRVPVLASLAFAYVHYWLVMRVNRLYVQARLQAAYAHEDREEASRKNERRRTAEALRRLLAAVGGGRD